MSFRFRKRSFIRKVAAGRNSGHDGTLKTELATGNHTCQDFGTTVYSYDPLTKRVVFMKTLVSITLAIAVALTGSPHAFCACGCGGLAALLLTEAPDRASSSCSSCGNHGSTPTPDGDRPPCTCRTCGAIEAAATAPATPVPPSANVRSASVPQVSFLIESAPVRSPGSYGETEPPGHFTGSQCALTILLGHLLL